MSEHDDRAIDGSGIDRRKFIRGAATVAWATPLILSMSTGSAHAQQVPSAPPCGAPGNGTGASGDLCPCLDGSDCASGCCCGGGAGPFAAGLLCATPQDCADAGGTCQ